MEQLENIRKVLFGNGHAIIIKKAITRIALPPSKRTEPLREK